MRHAVAGRTGKDGRRHEVQELRSLVRARKGGPEVSVGTYNCPSCSEEQPYRGTCQKCRKAGKHRGPRSDAKRTSHPIFKPRARVKAVSARRTLEGAAYKVLKVILSPFVKKCLRCSQPGSGWLSAKNPNGLEAHHPFRRRGWWLFVIVPLCGGCHREVEEDGNQARLDRWIVKAPIEK